MLAVLLAAGGAWADGYPPPDVRVPEEIYWQDFARGQLRPRHDVQLVQYRLDGSVRAERELHRFRQPGLSTELGSLTGRNLYTRLDMSLAHRFDSGFELRYGRRDWQDGRFDLRRQRFDGAWFPRQGAGLVLVAYPTIFKEDIPLGGGVHLASTTSTGHIRAVLIDDAATFRSKERRGHRLLRHPIHLVLDGAVRLGRTELWAHLDAGRPAEFNLNPDATALRLTRLVRSNARLDLGIHRQLDGGSLGARTWVRSSDELRAHEEGPATSTTRRQRHWQQLELYGTWTTGPWLAAGRIALSWQRDRFSGDAIHDGHYDARQWVGLVEGGYTGWPHLELRIGYLPSLYDMSRHLAAGDEGTRVLRPESTAGYTDKLQIRLIFRWQETAHLEALVSQELVEGGFGGGSVKAVLSF